MPAADTHGLTAIELADKLFRLDGFKHGDVAEHINKPTRFSKDVAKEYLRHFAFAGQPLDISMRQFFKAFSLKGETQERERILTAFAERYHEENPANFSSAASVDALVCALVLLNTDLHNAHVEKKMTLPAFLKYTVGMNGGSEFPQDVLKALYKSIKADEIEMPDHEREEAKLLIQQQLQQAQQLSQSDKKARFWSRRTGDANLNASLPNDLDSTGKDSGMLRSSSMPNDELALVKESIVERKVETESYGKKASDRSWKTYHIALRGHTLFFYKSGANFSRNLALPAEDSFSLVHSYAAPATEYTKREHVMQLTTHIYGTQLIQCKDSADMLDWVGIINRTAALLSTAPLAAPVGSQLIYHRPLQPTKPSTASIPEQYEFLRSHIESQVKELAEHNAEKDEIWALEDNKQRHRQNWTKKLEFLTYELERYRLYAKVLQSQLGVSPSASKRSSLISPVTKRAADASPLRERAMQNAAAAAAARASPNGSPHTSPLLPRALTIVGAAAPKAATNGQPATDDDDDADVVARPEKGKGRAKVQDFDEPAAPRHPGDFQASALRFSGRSDSYREALNELSV
ncbi:hypothetical protein CAOG_01506 [Capsaspora owczarzaki ATCC 30864]|uniref:Uncharacterized protein n=1 Tax=Capsaspora owczarzaki (strain ATCC 30864) TaxID=595528 RepID=A0A0D2X143_CAPO3|nr:hypothetical protein CAOG_01506 [Capsaspora owczarzaki ATCC 30864]KJE90159.1 hypothetical protein CAOG_001506 [Capsaspora owczarzaki ATCC 30864]|eukprot:XP_004364374.1 hypothetical protein CAOG_01506 [Capsaspora owczarzaki ATCC 30864]